MTDDVQIFLNSSGLEAGNVLMIVLIFFLIWASMFLQARFLVKEMSVIKAKWPKSSQKTPVLAWGPSFWPLRPILWPSITRFWPDLGHFAWIWPIMLGFGPFCLDLGHIAWILAIWQNGRTDGRTDGQIPPVFYGTLRSPPKVSDGQWYLCPTSVVYYQS